MLAFDLRPHPHKLGLFIDQYTLYLFERALSLKDGTAEEAEFFSDWPVPVEAVWHGLIRGGLYNERYAKEFGLTSDEVAFVKGMAGAILFKDEEGLVWVEYYESPEALEEAWDDLLSGRW